MNLLTISKASIASRPLQSALCILAVACAIALVVTVFLLSAAVESGFRRGAQNIDIVVGAKSGALELVLASVYHAEIPAGNIDLDEAQKIGSHPAVKNTIPLAVGDNYRGFRIVGTNEHYIDLFSGRLEEGAMFDNHGEAVAGALTGLATGQEIIPVHGFVSDEDHQHEENPLTVTGILAPTGTVLDRLIVTSIDDVRDMHEGHGHHHDHHDNEHSDEHTNEITALLLQVKNPAAVYNLPREINMQTNLTAAAPGYTMARLAKNFGLGKGLLYGLGGLFVFLSGMMLLSVLASSLAGRRYDLAVMRALGASSSRLASIIIAEGALIALSGSLLGVIAGHLIAYGVIMASPLLQGLAIPSLLLLPGYADAGFIALGLLCGGLASLLPAVQAARTDIAGLLARR